MGKINKLICPKTEDEIKLHWKYTDKVYVSCVCIAYNHELYIRDALDSILAQQTEYRFELIIHDDKSTDSTREIILEYKNKFPSIITLILQDENQYSKCKRIVPLTIPFLNGEYTTICEGDDFWIDQFKLQKQIKYLEEKKTYNICFTAGLSLNPRSEYSVISNHANNKMEYSLSDIINGGGEFIPTASIMLRTNILDKLPNWYFIAPVGDYFLQIFASIPFGALYLPDLTISYRENSIGSWSVQRTKLLPSDIIIESQLYEKVFLQLSDMCGEYYSSSIAMAKQYYKYSIFFLKNNDYTHSKYMIKKSWRSHRNINIKQKIIYHMRQFLPLLRISIILLRKKNNDK